MKTPMRGRRRGRAPSRRESGRREAGRPRRAVRGRRGSPRCVRRAVRAQVPLGEGGRRSRRRSAGRGRPVRRRANRTRGRPRQPRQRPRVEAEDHQRSPARNRIAGEIDRGRARERGHRHAILRVGPQARTRMRSGTRQCVPGLIRPRVEHVAGNHDVEGRLAAPGGARQEAGGGMRNLQAACRLEQAQRVDRHDDAGRVEALVIALAVPEELQVVADGAKTRHQLEGTHEHRLGGVEIALLHEDDAQHVNRIEGERCARDHLFVENSCRVELRHLLRGERLLHGCPQRRLLVHCEGVPAGVCGDRRIARAARVAAAAVLEAPTAAADAGGVAEYRGGHRSAFTRRGQGTRACRSSSPQAAPWAASRSRPRCRTTTATTPSGRTRFSRHPSTRARARR